MRYLIVNGDDFGLSPGVSRGIVDAHRRGILTSTSLLVNRPAAPTAAALALRSPGLSVGLHLELVPSEPDAAVESQLRRFERLLGRPPTHLDSHHDTHRSPELLPHVLAWAGRLGIPVRSHSPVARLSSFYAEWGGESHPEQVGVESLLSLLETGVGCGVTELVCHPGYVDRHLRSSYAAPRETELATLCDLRVREALAREGIRLIGFRDLSAALPHVSDGEVGPP